MAGFKTAFYMFLAGAIFAIRNMLEGAVGEAGVVKFNA